MSRAQAEGRAMTDAAVAIVTRPAVWCLGCREHSVASCQLCGGAACGPCDRCHGCGLVICAECNTAPKPRRAFPGDRQPHPHNERGWWWPSVCLS